MCLECVRVAILLEEAVGMVGDRAGIVGNGEAQAAALVCRVSVHRAHVLVELLH